jgi:4'-phosphopantetheinyl transferase
MLSEAERARARAFADDRLRGRYVCGRGQLRVVLGRLLGLPAAEVPLTRADDGKPRLAHPSPLRFNLSHCGDVALLALATAAEIGVDLERPCDPERELLADALTAGERDYVLSLAAPLRASAFARLWVRKEALLKAAGCGLLEHPTTFDVPTDVLVEPMEIVVRLQALGETRLWLVDLPSVSGCVAALASGVRPVTVRHDQLRVGPD